jgi:hypothetical protein
MQRLEFVGMDSPHTIHTLQNEDTQELAPGYLHSLVGVKQHRVENSDEHEEYMHPAPDTEKDNRHGDPCRGRYGGQELPERQDMGAGFARNSPGNSPELPGKQGVSGVLFKRSFCISVFPGHPL